MRVHASNPQQVLAPHGFLSSASFYVQWPSARSRVRLSLVARRPTSSPSFVSTMIDDADVVLRHTRPADPADHPAPAFRAVCPFARQGAMYDLTSCRYIAHLPAPGNCSDRGRCKRRPIAKPIPLAALPRCRPSSAFGRSIRGQPTSGSSPDGVCRTGRLALPTPANV